MVFDPRTALLKQKSLYDSRGALIGYCDIGQYQYFPEAEAAIPTEMKLHFRPGTELASVATIQLSNIRLNGLYVDPGTAWAMPNPTGITRVDLARTPMTPIPVQAATAAESAVRLPFRGMGLSR
jgi:hypothetical protein